MTKHASKWVIVASVTVGFSAVALAQDFDAGKSEFQSSCATCHGTDGKGKGPLSEQLRVAPADLTMLAKKNNGVFPVSAVYETIYGIRRIIAHGPPDMPIWGTDIMLEIRHLVQRSQITISTLPPIQMPLPEPACSPLSII